MLTRDSPIRMDIFEPYHVLFIQRLNHPAPDSCTVTDCPRLLEARNMTDFFRWAVEKGEQYVNVLDNPDNSTFAGWWVCVYLRLLTAVPLRSTPMTREEHPPGPTTPPPHPNRYN